jgi:hypothetical protein
LHRPLITGHHRVVDEGPNESTKPVDDQLSAIRILSQALEDAGIEYWLFGGWAVDFWVGEVTRPHDDIDVAAWRKDYDSIRAALVAAGWEHTPTAEDVVGTRYRLGQHEVEFTFVEPDDSGAVVVPLPTGSVTWSSQPFGDARARLRGVTCRIIPLAVLAEGKSTAREGVTEAAKDHADLAALSRLIGRE